MEELRSLYPLQVLFAVSGLKKQTYFYIRNKDDFDFKNLDVINKIEELYYKHRANYGYRRITDELNAQGIKINSKKVIRIMRKLSLNKSFTSQALSIGEDSHLKVFNNFLNDFNKKTTEIEKNETNYYKLFPLKEDK